MKKIELNEIKVKTPGVQIREKIIEKFGSIKAFADEIDLYESTIEQYLSSRKLGSSTFKIRTMKALGVDFNNLYLSDEEQIRYFTSTISWYIDYYNQFKDIFKFEKLKKLCLQKKLYEDYAIVCRCYAHYFMNQDKKDRAQAYIEVAANSMRGRENIDRFGLYLSELIYMKGKDVSKTVFNKLLSELNQTIKKVKGPLTKGHIYNNLGSVFNSFGDYEKSKMYYKKVFDYHKDPKSKAIVYMNIGNVEKNLGNNEKALQNYREAEKLLSKEDDFIKYVYNEYALYYLKQGDVNKAETYINKIFSDQSWNISGSNHDFLITYARIKNILKKEDEIIDVVKRLLNEICYEYIYIIKHLSLVEEIVMWDYDDDVLLEKLKKVVIDFYLNNDIEIGYEVALKKILGSISINLHKNRNNFNN